MFVANPSTKARRADVLQPRAPEELHPSGDVPLDTLNAAAGHSSFAAHVSPARSLDTQQATETTEDDLLGTPSLAPGFNKHTSARPAIGTAHSAHSGATNFLSENGLGGQGRRVWAQCEHRPRTAGSTEITPGLPEFLADVDNTLTKPPMVLKPFNGHIITDQNVCRHVGCHRFFPTREGLRLVIQCLVRCAR